jgi:hypothetical protein
LGLFVSANPTGPLHVGHGRGAAYGATVANLLRVVGFEVDNEYYVNAYVYECFLSTLKFSCKQTCAKIRVI